MQKTKLRKKEKELELELEKILTDEEILAPDPKEENPKVLVGYHPISGAEVWQ